MLNRKSCSQYSSHGSRGRCRTARKCSPSSSAWRAGLKTTPSFVRFGEYNSLFCRLREFWEQRLASDSVRIRYRPVRLGWCVREGNWDDLRSVLRSAHPLWGGVFGPILSVGAADQAARLVGLYEVDALFPAADDPQLRAFVDRFPHLRWPACIGRFSSRAREEKGTRLFWTSTIRRGEFTKNTSMGSRNRG